MPRHLMLALATVVLYALHQDVWNWRTAHPVLFGVLPVGLAYHAGYSLAAAALLAAYVRFAWPADLEREAEAKDRPASEAGAPRA